MSKFDNAFKVIMEELANSAATAMGGPNGQPAGTYGNQFPSNNDNGFNPGDARWAYGKDEFKIAKPSKPGKRGKTSKSSKKPKIRVQRRNLGPSM